MDGERGTGGPTAQAERLAMTALSCRRASVADILAIALRLKTVPAGAGPYARSTAPPRSWQRVRSDADLLNGLQDLDPSAMAGWPRSDLTAALFGIVERLATADRRARSAGIGLLAALSRTRPGEVLDALNLALQDQDVRAPELTAVVRGLRRALKAPPAPRLSTRRRSAGSRPDGPRRHPDHSEVALPPHRPGTDDRYPIDPEADGGADGGADFVTEGGPSGFAADEDDDFLIDGGADFIAGPELEGPGPPTRGESNSPGGPAVPTGPVGPAAPTSPDGAAVPTSPVGPAYPTVKVIGPGEKRGVAVAGVPFTVLIGVGPRPVGTQAATKVEIPDSLATLTVRLLYDPNSLQLSPNQPVELSLAPGAPPLTITMTAVEDDTLSRIRRVGVAYFADAHLVGLAWASVFVVPDLATAAAVDIPPAPNLRMLDLSVLQQPEPPDLVLAVTTGDAAAGDQLVWTAFAGPDAPPIPDDGPERENKAAAEDIASFTQSLRTFVATVGDEQQVYTQMAGVALQIAKRISPTVIASLRTLITAADGDHRPPPAVLLVSDELGIPWELAGISVTSAAGGSSPFLGAHAAVSRWPMDVADPPPKLVQTRTISSTATVADGFADVKGLKPLPSAPLEAANLSHAYPPVIAVTADWISVKKLMTGNPPADLIHLALHGNFDASGTRSGIFVIKTIGTKTIGGEVAGESREPDLVTPEQIAAMTRTTAPFVFVNACQLGATKPVLGDSSGMAVSLLSSGACGVVVSIWNVNDVAAADVAARFYRGVFDDGASVAEALRRIRATYTEDAAQPGSAITSTLIGYQAFGHPNLRLVRPNPPVH